MKFKKNDLLSLRDSNNIQIHSIEKFKPLFSHNYLRRQQIHNQSDGHKLMVNERLEEYSCGFSQRLH